LGGRGGRGEKEQDLGKQTYFSKALLNSKRGRNGIRQCCVKGLKIIQGPGEHSRKVTLVTKKETVKKGKKRRGSRNKKQKLGTKSKVGGGKGGGEEKTLAPSMTDQKKRKGKKTWFSNEKEKGEGGMKRRKR